MKKNESLEEYIDRLTEEMRQLRANRQKELDEWAAWTKRMEQRLDALDAALGKSND